MERVRIAALFADKEQYGGASVTVCGWAKTIRDMKTFGFIELNDGSCFRNLQVVMDANSLSNYKEIAAQNVGAALIVRGTVVLTPEAKQFIIDAAYERCEDILSRDQKHLIAVAEFLLAHETMSAEEFEAVFTDEAAGHDKI